MDNYQELIADLREVTSRDDCAFVLPQPNGLGHLRAKVIEAADAIDALQARVSELEKFIGTLEFDGTTFTTYGKPYKIPDIKTS